MYLRCPPKVSSIIEQPTLDAGGWWTSPASRGGGDFWTFFSLLGSDYSLTLWGLYKSLSPDASVKLFSIKIMAALAHAPPTRYDQGRSHSSSKRRKRAGAPQNELLDRLPKRDNTLCQHALVNDLSIQLKEEIREWLVASFPGSPEIAIILLDHVAVQHPTHLRVKELFETVEVVKHAGNHIYQQKLHIFSYKV